MCPRTDPWGTPWLGVRAGEEWFSMDIDVVRPLIKGVSHASDMSAILMSCRRLISMQWLIVSKAENKASNASTEPCSLSRFDSRSPEILVSSVLMDFLGM